MYLFVDFLISLFTWSVNLNCRMVTLVFGSKFRCKAETYLKDGCGMVGVKLGCGWGIPGVWLRYGSGIIGVWLGYL